MSPVINKNRSLSLVELNTDAESLGVEHFNGTADSHSPQILRGASSSRRIGWLKKISLDLMHNPRISPSVSCTFFPGLEPRTEIQERNLDPANFRMNTDCNISKEQTFQKSLNNTVDIKLFTISHNL